MKSHSKMRVQILFFFSAFSSSSNYPSRCDAFLQNQSTKSFFRSHIRPTTSMLKTERNSKSNGNNSGNNNSADDIQSYQERILNKKLIDVILNNGKDQQDNNNSSLGSVDTNFVGIGTLGPSDDPSLQSDCLFLIPSTANDIFQQEKKKKSISTANNEKQEYPCIPVPLPSSTAKKLIKLLSFAYKSEPISKSLCLALSPILINRDGALYDNLPWDTWTIDPLKRNTDSAGNNIEKKYHLGKRDAYNRFMGKDWWGRSASIGNLAARAKYLLENENENDSRDRKGEAIILDQSAAKILAKRVLELEVKESRMAVAAAEEQLAILRAELGSVNVADISDDLLVKNYDALQEAIEAVNNAQLSLDESEEALSTFNKEEQPKQSEMVSLLSMIMESQRSQAPYRGAYGYKPVIDSKEEMFRKSILPYSSPYELMTEIIDEQLNAKVIGCLIENTSLFNGSIVLGGTLILKRKTVQKKISIDGETLMVDDSDDNLGNEGINSGDLKIVECDCDEAIGMAITNGLCINIERDVWEKSQMRCTIEENDVSSISDLNRIFPNIKVDESIILKTQGKGEKSIGTPILVPRVGNDRFRDFFASSAGRTVFDTEIPVNTLLEYDQMTVQDKAKLLLSLESFKGRLPRPRDLRQSRDENDSTLDPLDQMLVPLIDESVRRQILSREAKRRGAIDEAENLDRQKSMRQVAKENAQRAKEDGNTELALAWENEAEFYASLRADVTQDEGTYSSFLDRDEWYERDRRAVAERNKKRFGSLFDGLQ
jgi:hypothetical protein